MLLILFQNFNVIKNFYNTPGETDWHKKAKKGGGSAEPGWCTGALYTMPVEMGLQGPQ